MEPGGRLVEDEQHVLGTVAGAVLAPGRREVPRELQPLRLAARERRHRLAEPQVPESHRGQWRERTHDRRGFPRRSRWRRRRSSPGCRRWSGKRRRVHRPGFQLRSRGRGSDRKSRPQGCRFRSRFPPRSRHLHKDAPHGPSRRPRRPSSFPPGCDHELPVRRSHPRRRRRWSRPLPAGGSSRRALRFDSGGRRSRGSAGTRR